MQNINSIVTNRIATLFTQFDDSIVNEVIGLRQEIYCPKWMEHGFSSNIIPQLNELFYERLLATFLFKNNMNLLSFHEETLRHNYPLQVITLDYIKQIEQPLMECGIKVVVDVAPVNNYFKFDEFELPTNVPAVYQNPAIVVNIIKTALEKHSSGFVRKFADSIDVADTTPGLAHALHQALEVSKDYFFIENIADRFLFSKDNQYLCHINNNVCFNTKKSSGDVWLLD